ncbi:DUF3299 domain-containing protein [Luteibacter aegosomaticola]|uniref:DUF3299 domain-containing protein n=1 Tax=Luteibacter aegosomaticola TaxID=2911538 RepID=UPI001FFBE8A4|nr:DUF3299 domain-containing protein [Luteibacter aegosomaticola]UPG88118.1 DUF3299 domain-containing protein [Luteibacter aegosomaticola]
MIVRNVIIAVVVVTLVACGQSPGAPDAAPAASATTALASAQAKADATRAARAKAQADGIVAARAFAAAHGSPKAAAPKGAGLLGAADADGYADLDWSHMMPPEDIKLLRDAPPVLHVGNQRMKQIGTLHTVAALDNQKVKLSGYVVPLESDNDGKMIEFFFVPFYGACIHVPPPPPNMLIHVRLAHGIDTPSLYDPLTLKGVLHTEVTQNAMASSAYAMDDAALGAYKDPDTDRLRQAFE